MFSLLGKICDYFGISLSFLNKDHSPSNKVGVKGSSVGAILQAGRDIHFHQSKNLSNRISQKIGAVAKSDVLRYLDDEWKLAPQGYRYSKNLQTLDGVSEEQGLEAIIAPNRLLSWCKGSGLTISQLGPILQGFVSEGLLRSFEFFEGQWSDEDEEETALKIEFNPNFEAAYKKRASLRG